jgi:hypothetical protein
METVDYTIGKGLIAGEIITDQLPLVADTYYVGMPLRYLGAVAVTQTGTGNGVLSDVIAGVGVVADVYTLTFTAALIFDVTNAAGDILAQGLVMADGAATTFTVEGITFTVTDGSTAFVATDTLVATITAGNYSYTTDAPDVIYNGINARVLATVAYSDCILWGELLESGIKDDAGDAVTFTDAIRALYRSNGLFIKAVN